MRYLSEEQIPTEDKIQVKNLIYHSIKNALSTIETSATTNNIKSETKKPSSPIKEEGDA